jgi:hypothetical protein
MFDKTGDKMRVVDYSIKIIKARDTMLRCTDGEVGVG